VIAGIEMVGGFHPYQSLGVVAAAWPLLCLAAVILVPAMGHLRWRTGGLVLLVSLPTLALIAATLVTPRSVFDSRYLTVCVPPIYLLLTGGWNMLPRTRTRALAGGVLIAAGVATAVWQNSDPGNPKLYGLRDAVRAVDQYAQAGDAVMLVPQVNELNGHDAVLNYYRLAPGLRHVDTTPDGRAGTVAPQVMWQRLAVNRPARVFVVYGYDALTYRASARTQVTTGAQLSASYDQFIRQHARVVAGLHYANVTLRVYAPHWTTTR
jgi:hypothetical protein